MKYILFLLLPIILTSQTYICDSMFLVTRDTSEGPYNRFVEAKAITSQFIIDEKAKVIIRKINDNFVIYYNAYQFTQTIDNKLYIYYQSKKDNNSDDIIFIDPYLNAIKYCNTVDDKYMYFFSVKKIIYKE